MRFVQVWFLLKQRWNLFDRCRFYYPDMSTCRMNQSNCMNIEVTDDTNVAILVGHFKVLQKIYHCGNSNLLSTILRMHCNKVKCNSMFLILLSLPDMASLSLNENDGDQDTLGPLPQQQGGIPWMTGPPAYGYLPMPQYPPPQDAITPGYAQSVSYCSSHSGSRSPHSQSGSSSRRSDKGGEDHKSSGGSSSERSGSSRGKDRKSERGSVNQPAPQNAMQPRSLDQVPDSVAASRNSFRMAMGNPCEFFVDVMWWEIFINTNDKSSTKSEPAVNARKLWSQYPIRSELGQSCNKSCQ